MPYSIHLLRHLRQTIGCNIHDQRLRRKLTLTKLSRLTEISITRLDQYEMGKHHITLDDLFKIAGVLDSEITHFMLQSCPSPSRKRDDN